MEAIVVLFFFPSVRPLSQGSALSSPVFLSFSCSAGSKRPAYHHYWRACWLKRVLFPLPVGYILGCLLFVRFPFDSKLSPPSEFHSLILCDVYNIYDNIYDNVCTILHVYNIVHIVVGGLHLDVYAVHDTKDYITCTIIVFALRPAYITLHDM